MWHLVSHIILKFRIPLLLVVGALTVFMAMQIPKAQLNYSFDKVIPEDHPYSIKYDSFKNKFGEDGNIMVIGVRSPDLFDYTFLNAWYELGKKIEGMEGIAQVVSVADCYMLEKNKEEKRFEFIELQGPVRNREIADSFSKIIEKQEFYHGLLYNPETKATLMAITFEQGLLNSRERIDATEHIEDLGNSFAERYNVDLHYSGLPFLRSKHVTIIANELQIFLAAAILFTALLLLLLFRSFSAVIFPMIVVGIGVCWSIGTTVLLGYNISILTGLIPTLIVVIGIPNCVYLLNKFHAEYKKHGDKEAALTEIIEKIGFVTFFANLTTAIGFGVFWFTNVRIMKEFGIVAGLNIAATFIISLIIIPVIFSFLPDPNKRHVGHLDRRVFNFVLNNFNYWTRHKRKSVFAITIVIVVASVISIFGLKSRGYMLDDIPKNKKVYKDLKFFEHEFRGLMPIEFLISAKSDSVDLQTSLEKMDEAHDLLMSYPVISKPISVLELFKFGRQAYYKGSSRYYSIKNFKPANRNDRNSWLISRIRKTALPTCRS